MNVQAPFEHAHQVRLASRVVAGDLRAHLRDAGLDGRRGTATPSSPTSSGSGHYRAWRRAQEVHQDADRVDFRRGPGANGSALARRRRPDANPLQGLERAIVRPTPGIFSGGGLVCSLDAAGRRPCVPSASVGGFKEMIRQTRASSALALAAALAPALRRGPAAAGSLSLRRARRRPRPPATIPRHRRRERPRAPALAGGSREARDGEQRGHRGGALQPARTASWPSRRPRASTTRC